MSYSEFLQNFNFPVTPKEYAVVFDAIPTGSLQILKHISFTDVSAEVNRIFIGDTDITKKAYTNKYIRNQISCSVPPAAKFFWYSTMGDLNWEKANTIIYKYCINNKIKEVSFKILHQIYPVKDTLRRFKINIEESCVFCQSNRETIFHLFYHCMYTKKFWSDLEEFIITKLNVNIRINIFDVMLYFYLCGLSKNLIFVIQLFIIFGKYHIHKCKWSNSQPSFNVFHLDFKTYYKTIENMQNMKATRTFHLLKELNIF